MRGGASSAHSRASGNPEQDSTSLSPVRCSSPIRPARCTGRTNAAGRRRSASGKRLGLRQARRAAAALRYGDDVGAAGAPHRALRAASRDRAGRQLSRRPRTFAHERRRSCGAHLLQRGRDWIWIAGNHDPDLPDGIGGGFADVLALGPLMFRHEPSPDPCDGEIAGHLHPLARVAQRGRAVRRRCFASDGRRLVMPAFGAYAGGLNVRDRAIFGLFGTLAFTAHMLGDAAAFCHRRGALPAGLKISPAGTQRWRSSRSTAPSWRSPARRAGRARARH